MNPPSKKRGGARTQAAWDRDMTLALWSLTGDWPADLGKQGQSLLWEMAHQDASSSLADLLGAVRAVLAPLGADGAAA